MQVYPVLRPLLFQLDPETAHGAGMAALRLAQGLPGVAAALARHNLVDAAPLRQTLFGRELATPWASPPVSTRTPPWCGR